MRLFSQSLQLVLNALAILAGAIFSLIAAAIAVNVALRALDAPQLRGMVDLIEAGMVAATFLAAPWVLSKNAHVTVDVVTTALPIETRRRLARAVCLLGMVVSAVLFWSALQAVMVSYGRGSMVRGILVYPEWWPLLAPTISGALLALEFARRTITGVDVVDRQASGI
ncbi:TRAP transporter small permease [Amorphus sp. MBR-141]